MRENEILIIIALFISPLLLWMPGIFYSPLYVHNKNFLNKSLLKLSKFLTFFMQGHRRRVVRENRGACIIHRRGCRQTRQTNCICIIISSQQGHRSLRFEGMKEKEGEKSEENGRMGNKEKEFPKKRDE